MSEEKIAAFYVDPHKVACDALSNKKAFELRSLSTDDGLSWRAAALDTISRAFREGLLRTTRAHIHKDTFAGSAPMTMRSAAVNPKRLP
jgi:hypothetical protein